MGVKAGDVLLVHSSLKSVGSVEGGADGLLAAMEGALKEGLLVLPTLSYSTIGPGNPVFSVNDTPSCVGALTEAFRKRAGVARSWHPTHSVAASGRDAPAFVAGHERFDTPCARESPWGRLLDRKGKILFLGVSIDCNTTLHGVEEWANVPGKITDAPEALKILTPDGRLLDRPSRRHIPDASFHYGKLKDVFLKEGVMVAGRLGDAACFLADVAAMVGLVMRYLQRDIRFLCRAGSP